ncbi:hypothetical protein HELRODRAFT_168250 [Helobdella robusta]|uniref:Uncharacterized protein n=1 Tax=Helobdella robusta TaxID=6412 RepID=T1F0C8_HELRO|nr:hypothetical protein HELRODRAFT_168250 [Helobdella robusta]ESO09288.1 hypothetical protein HELRODRAFT_168250 [Helobdella robusta]
MADLTSREYYQKGNECFVDENYDEALQFYKKALELDARNDQCCNSLSQLYLKQNNYSEMLNVLKTVTEALKYASMSIDLNPDISSAFLRKGIALFNLEKYELARQAFKDGLTKRENDAKLMEWLEKCEKKLPVLKSSSQTSTSDSTKQSANILFSNNSLKTKYDWYQTETHIVLTILLKNVRSDELKYNITENTLSCTITQPSRPEYSLELDLAHSVCPDKIQVKILSTKVEIKLMKQEGIMWSKLEHDGNLENIKSIKNEKCTATSTNEVSGVVKKYPSSSLHTKNWDQLVNDIKAEEKDEKLDGDAALNQLFQQIYADGSDDVKKAMMKSFSESGGTVLSTNWNEIGAKKVDVKPPDGMEFKKW